MVNWPSADIDMNWIKTHKKATCALLGCALIWSGLVMMWTLPAMLITTGCVLAGGTLMSYLPDDVK